MVSRKDLLNEMKELNNRKDTHTSLELTKTAANNANFALRSLIYINAGAVVALLTFIGHTKYDLTSDTIYMSIGCFAVGIFAAILGIVKAYEWSKNLSDSFEHFRHGNNEVDYKTRSIGLIEDGISCAYTSMLFFCFGALFAVIYVKSFTPKQNVLYQGNLTSTGLFQELTDLKSQMKYQDTKLENTYKEISAALNNLKKALEKREKENK